MKSKRERRMKRERGNAPADEAPREIGLINAAQTASSRGHEAAACGREPAKSPGGEPAGSAAGLPVLSGPRGGEWRRGETARGRHCSAAEGGGDPVEESKYTRRTYRYRVPDTWRQILSIIGKPIRILVFVLVLVKMTGQAIFEPAVLSSAFG